MTTEPADYADRRPKSKAIALRFVLVLGVVSFFADFAYEGARSIVGPYLAVLGASATAVGFVAGFGELIGYALRLLSGRVSDRTRQFWPITLFGYAISMSAVPMLALAGSWQFAAVLLLLERMGKAIRNPPRDVLLSHAAQEVGYGWGFGLHQAMDQCGALVGPLIVAIVLAAQGGYSTAFALLLVPALMTLGLLLVARFLYPQPDAATTKLLDLKAEGLPAVFWIYLAAAALVAAGFADFALMSYHFAKAQMMPASWIPIVYAAAMGVSGAASLVFGWLFDRVGLVLLIPLTIVSSLFAPLVFLGAFPAAIAGSVLWGIGMGVHESIMRAAVAQMAPPQRRASAYGLFTAGYGVSWFLGSAVMGLLYEVSLPALVVFSVAAELAAIPLFLVVTRRSGKVLPENSE
jgi:MFS family permease